MTIPAAGYVAVVPTSLALATAATLASNLAATSAIIEWHVRSQPQGAAALRRAPPILANSPAQPLREAQPAHPRRPGAAVRRRPAVVARGPWLRRQPALAWRRQDHPRRHRCRWQSKISCARHRRPRYQGILGSKKVGMRPDAGEGEKRTNEIGTVIPLLETLPDIANRTVTARCAAHPAGAGQVPAWLAAQTICSPSRATSRPCVTTSASCSMRPSPGARRTS